MEEEDGMKTKGIILIVLGVLGGIFVSTFDIIMQKPVNDLTGPRSLIALVVCVFFIIIGIRFLLKRPGP